MVAIHKQLQIVRGVNPAPADTQTAEAGYTILNLLTTGTGGFQLKNDIQGWNPGLPAPKPGLWSDVPFIDGRTPIANAVQNVTETMSIILSAQTHLLAAQYLSTLYDMQHNCNDYWNDEFELEPVFLWWWAYGAPGPQYALIMNMDIDVQIPTTEDETVILRDVTLTIEREPYWRGLPPGQNPIYWTLYMQNKQPGHDFDYLGDLQLGETPNGVGGVLNPLAYYLVFQQANNRVDYLSLSPTVNSINAENRITIPAASIPGDAPALLQVSLSHISNDGPAAGSFNYSYIVSQCTRKRTATMRDADLSRYVTLLPFTAGAYSAAATLQADTGGINGFNVTTSAVIAVSRISITPVSAVLISTVTWVYGLQINIERGRFAVFARCRQVGGASGDMTMRVKFSGGNSVAPFYSDTARPTVVAGAGNTDFFPLTYLGQVRLPPDRDSALALAHSGATPTPGQTGGTGLWNDAGGGGGAVGGGLTIELQVARSTGAGVLYFTDLILMPFDEGMVDANTLDPESVGVSSVSNTTIIDNTGYLSRGKPFSVAAAYASQQYGLSAVEQRGSALTLEPGVENSLYFLEYNQNEQSSPRSRVDVSVNIIPRWRSVRDV